MLRNLCVLLLLGGCTAREVERSAEVTAGLVVGAVAVVPYLLLR